MRYWIILVFISLPHIASAQNRLTPEDALEVIFGLAFRGIQMAWPKAEWCARMGVPNNRCDREYERYLASLRERNLPEIDMPR